LPDVVLTPSAESDLDDIWLAIARDNRLAADRLLKRIGEKLQRLSVFPEMGSPRPEVAPTARLLIEGNYLILYEASPTHVVVVRVLHGARDLTDLL